MITSHGPQRPALAATDCQHAMHATGRRFAGTMASALFLCRRIVLAIAPRLINRRFAFAISVAATLSAKLVHIYAHLDALPTIDLLFWGASFFAQDVAFLLVLRLLLENWLGIITTILASVLIPFVLSIAAISISFFFTAGTELQWRNIVVAGDSSSWSTLLTGLMSCTLVSAVLFMMAGIFQLPCELVSNIALHILKLPVTFLSSKLSILRRYNTSDTKYRHIPQGDVETSGEQTCKEVESDGQDMEDISLDSSKSTSILVMLVGIGLMAQVLGTILRPTESSFIYMSWTLPLMPFVDFAQSTPQLTSLHAFSGNVNGTLDNTTALAPPIQYPWLPKDTKLPGFEDWYETDKDHYLAANDPLKLSNLRDELLPALRHKLRGIKIRHVMLIKLESTRKDVFPIKKGQFIWDRLTKSFGNASLPLDAQQRLATLTSTAKLLTGDFDDGFDQQSQQKPRGGINANNAFTTSTYTLKSLTGTHCGLSPLLADFNIEPQHHVYQPCLPHIFNALNHIDHKNDRTSNDDFTSFKWKSAYMQSVTLRYDKQDHLMPVLGFVDPIGWWELKNETAKFSTANLTDVNYYGMPEVAIEEYVRDAFASAKANNERLFLSHLTSSTHHDFGIPKDEKYVPLAGEKELNDLSRYLNAVGYVDRWLKKVLDILEEEGVADETLVVLVGDHGLSLAERGSITPYSNPHVANYHVPLVLSHPKLPHINVDDAVSSIQILPTILDLLLETASLSKSETQAVRDLVQNYEGQSLLRPLRKFSEKNGQGSWQYTLMNPGGSTLAVRDARKPNWRLIVPVFGNYEWRFTDLESDPHEKSPLVSFDFKTVVRIVEEKQGAEAAKWVEEAAVVARWWAGENYKRWRYHPK